MSTYTYMDTLTPKEERLLGFIENYQMKNGSSPTVREMREFMELKSDGFVVHCLKSLHKKGMIEKDDTPRGIKLLPSVSDKLHAEFIKIPVLGSIPAGGPVVTEENVESWMTFESGQLKNPKQCFVLKVTGDSMINAGILDGDHIIASMKAAPRVGDVVVALVDGGSTVKRYMKGPEGYYLKPENEKYKNIYPEAELEIQGVVVGLMRWY